MRQTVDEIARRFEAAWRNAESRPAIRQFLPAPAAAARAAVLARLVKIDQHERWRCGEQPLLETYLEEWPEPRGSATVISELLHSECEVRAALGTSPTPEEWEQRVKTIYERVDLNTMVLPAGADLSDAPAACEPQRPVPVSPDTIPGSGDATPIPQASWSVSPAGCTHGTVRDPCLAGCRWHG